MKTIFKCEFCDYQSKDGTVSAKIDVQEHERGCVHNPKNFTIDYLINECEEILGCHDDSNDEYDLGVRYALDKVLNKLVKMKNNYGVK